MKRDLKSILLIALFLSGSSTGRPASQEAGSDGPDLRAQAAFLQELKIRGRMAVIEVDGESIHEVPTVPNDPLPDSIGFYLNQKLKWNIRTINNVLTLRERSLDEAFKSDPLDVKIDWFASQGEDLDTIYENLGAMTGVMLSRVRMSKTPLVYVDVALEKTTLRAALVDLARSTGNNCCCISYLHGVLAPGKYLAQPNFVSFHSR